VCCAVHHHLCSDLLFPFCHTQFGQLRAESGVRSRVDQSLTCTACAQVYLLAGLAGEGASLVFSDAVTVGASGAIFGLLGAPAGRVLMFLQSVRALLGRPTGHVALF